MLNGTKAAFTGEWPGNFFAGNGTLRVYIDESANEELDELAHGGDPAQVPAGPSTPCVRSSLATVGDGWAPWSSQ